MIEKFSNPHLAPSTRRSGLYNITIKNSSW